MSTKKVSIQDSHIEKLLDVGFIYIKLNDDNYVCLEME